MVRRIKLLSPAKLNLYLDVLGEYRDGFHKIESVLNRISLFDEITIELTSSPQIRIQSNQKYLATKDNLCVKAAALLQKQLGLKHGFSIYLKKNIPIGAGLGGGSSNAAYTILGILLLLNLKLSKKILFSLGEKLGSDVNFFLTQRMWGYIWGRGEKVSPLEIDLRLRYIIVYPRIVLPTKEVYQRWGKGELTKKDKNVNILLANLQKKNTVGVEKECFNALERIVLSLCEDLRGVKQFFQKKRKKCLLTGGGSSFFSIVTDERIKGKLLREIKRQKWQVFVVQTY